MTTKAGKHAEHIEKEIRGVVRKCKGPKLLTGDEQRPYLEAITKATVERLPDLAKKIVELRRRLGLPFVYVEEMDEEERKIYRLKGKILPKSVAKQESGQVLSWALETVRANESDRGKACGYDFNETILAHPFDGKERAYKCPKCGVEGAFRSPLYSIATSK